MQRRLTHVRVLAVASLLFVLAAFVVGGGAVAAKQADGPARGEDGLLRLRRDAAGSRGQVRVPGRDADHGGAHGGRRQGAERPRPGLPAEHRRRLDTLATGAYPGEHGSTNNTFFRQGDSSFNNRPCVRDDRRSSRPTTSRRRPSAPARTVVSVEWVGARAPDAGAPGPGRRLPELLLDPRRPHVPARPERAGRRRCIRRLVPGGGVRARGGLDEHVPPATAAAPPKQTLLTVTTSVRRPEPNAHVRLLHLRQRRQRHSRTTTVSSSSGRGSGRTRAPRTGLPSSPRASGPRSSSRGRWSHRRPRRPDRRLLRQARRPRAGALARSSSTSPRWRG